MLRQEWYFVLSDLKKKRRGVLACCLCPTRHWMVRERETKLVISYRDQSTGQLGR